MNTSKLIIALDRPSLDAGLDILDRLPASIQYVKVGLELFIAEGPEAVRALQRRKKNIFLDLKLHDIPNTVARAVAAAAKLGATLLTLHAGGGRAMMQAAADAAKQSGRHAPKLIAVTALTSLAPPDLADLGIRRTMTDQVLALGAMALDSGLDGLVCFVHEAEILRRQFGPTPILVTPGIRPAFAQVASAVAKEAMADTSSGKPAFAGRLTGKTTADQKRIATPSMAVKAGASFLVVGRPILDAPDPAAAAAAILNEMESAQSNS